MDISVSRRPKLIRFALWLLVVCAVLAAIGLIYESARFARSMPDRGWNFQILRLVGLVGANLIFTAVLAVAAVLYLWVRIASSLPALRGWHIQEPESEFRAAEVRTGFTLDTYLEQEDRIFRELDALVAGPWASQSPGTYSRYHEDSVCNPATIVDRNWNRSFVMESPNPIGGVLLLHGLSDSPYSLRVLGERLHAEGYTVVWLRIPGHGTSPSALANVSWKDWTAAVKIAVCGLRDLLPEGTPLVLGGYSNGGALSVHYALSSINDTELPKANAIVLFSPMLGINPMARITRLYHMVAMISGNQKSQWSSINAEIDPFKYSSWPMNGNVQAWAVTQAVERMLVALEKSGRMNEMPPVLAMQSVVDSTVVVPKLITVLFDRLESESNELFLFDINRVDWLSNLLNRSFEQAVAPKLQRTDLPYRLSVLRNAQEDSPQVVVQTREGESWSEQAVDMSWPDGVVSLSHIAVPFPPEDPIYGSLDATSGDGLSLGSLSMRAEPTALLIPSSLFVRCRHNPFYAFMENRVVRWLAQTANAAPSRKS
jgi:alpha-beta hydrolase superfamily lysophospholipase